MVLIFAHDQDAATALREAGLKATPQRLAILRSLSGDETHPTAQELYERLRTEFPGLSVATVYNTLSALTRIDRCRPLELGGPLRFDPNVSSHDHAVCERCGAIRDVKLSQGKEASPDLAGFQVSRVERIYRGLCASCSESREAAQH
jgi:Fur family peroxide stress response transcriptional regulator